MTKETKDAICGQGMCPYVPCNKFPKCIHVNCSGIVLDKETDLITMDDTKVTDVSPFARAKEYLKLYAWDCERVDDDSQTEYTIKAIDLHHAEEALWIMQKDYDDAIVKISEERFKNDIAFMERTGNPRCSICKALYKQTGEYEWESTCEHSKGLKLGFLGKQTNGGRHSSHN